MSIKKDESISEIMLDVNKFITKRWDVFYSVDVKQYTMFGLGILDGFVCGVLVEHLLKKHSKDIIDITIIEWVVQGDNDDIKMCNFKNMQFNSLQCSRKYDI